MLLQTTQIDQIERALGESLTGVASELRLVDAADFIAFIRMRQTANLRNIVQSSTELHFKPGTLRLAEEAASESGWATPPLIALPMEFQHGGVRVYFKLELAAHAAAVALQSVVAEAGVSEFREIEIKLHDALRDAKIRRRQQIPDGAQAGRSSVQAPGKMGIASLGS